MIELVALDIAGTTVEEHSAVYVALEAAVREAGADPTAADIREWMGAGKREAITGLLTRADVAPHPSEVETTFERFAALLDEAYSRTPPTPMPGVVEAFDRLRTAGIRVALTTGFDRIVTDKLLSGLGWSSDVLDAVVCIDDVPAGRPAPYLIFRAMELTGVQAVSAVAVAGDTIRDLEAGTNAGAAVVAGVLTGGVPRDVLAFGPHTHILATVAELCDIVLP